jgi:hypothetical protein
MRINRERESATPLPVWRLGSLFPPFSLHEEAAAMGWVAFFFFLVRSWVAFGLAVGLPKNENGGYKHSECNGLLLVRRRKMEGITIQSAVGCFWFRVQFWRY